MSLSISSGCLLFRSMRRGDSPAHLSVHTVHNRIIFVIFANTVNNTEDHLCRQKLDHLYDIIHIQITERLCTYVSSVSIYNNIHSRQNALSDSYLSSMILIACCLCSQSHDVCGISCFRDWVIGRPRIS